MVNDKSTPEESGAHRDVHEKSGAPYIEVSGSQATRELRDTSRRRREAEEKLQQHLMEAKEHAHEAEHAAHKTPDPAEGAGHESAVHDKSSHAKKARDAADTKGQDS
ncbi:hypothetical protein J2809_002387 [Arthrobacter pascens]|uniref:hypothetical protein n=1 Tax=Arthrobacter pascens TaxID=1677 RepID=UPI002859BE5F|nr:hypothetical protein [Arthrobacter pascens]MDR6558027.1 hypothetical protein [Arthrobacter pascens]